jgi:type 1 glutamine amidotransferase
MKRILAAIALASFSAGGLNNCPAAETKIVMIAGKPSHGPGEHEHNAGIQLLAKCLRTVPDITVETFSGGWASDPAALDGAATVVIYSDGGDGHPALQENHLQQLAALKAKGAGLVCIHYAVEPTKEKGEKEFIEWLGGCFEINWSVNPEWEADFTQLPNHPITRGVKPFKIRDEWYYHMRFADGMKGVTPILSARPSAETLSRPDGPHSGNPDVRKAVAAGEPQTVAWAYESPAGARGFGFTGGHFHKNWGDPNVRKLVLNAILWTAKVEVPQGGVDCAVTDADLEKNLDSKGGKAKAAAAPANAK